MKKPLLIIAFFALTIFTISAQTQQTILHARIWLDGKTMLDLENAGLEMDHGFYEPGQSFRSEFAASELSRVKTAGFRIDTLEADVVATYLRENATLKPLRTQGSQSSNRNVGPCDDYSASAGTPVNYTYGTMGGYYIYEEFLDILDDMRAKFPHLISARQVVSPTLLTHEGRPQWFVRISDQPDSEDASEPEALYTALHHAREPNSLTHLIYFMWHILENYDRDAELRYLVDNTELYFIPCLNPDGYIYNQTTNPEGGGYWRKNRRDNGDGSFGVDLNRNYSYNWGPIGGSSGSPSSDTYRGPDPFSEPETQMAKEFIEAHNFEIVLNCHTSGNKLVHPWGYENSVPTPDFTTLSEWFTGENNYLHGSCWQTLGYLANGTSDDWMYGEKGKFAFTPETGSGFWPTIDKIDGNNKGMLRTNLSAAWYALGGAVIRQQPGKSFLGNTLSVPFKIKQYELGTTPIQISFEALTSNILGFSTIAPISINDFETSSLAVSVTLDNAIQAGESIRFVAKADRAGQIHTDTIEVIFNPTPFTPLLTDNNELPNTQWVSNSEWGQTTEHAYSPSKSMTDSPNDIYYSEENTLTTSASLLIPNNADEARLRFFARWDIERELDWAQVLVSTDGGGVFAPLEGSLTNLSAALTEPVYDGVHPFWEEECIDLNAYIGQPFLLRFAMTSFSGNPFGRDGFYFDDLLLEYKTDSGVFTIDIPDNWKLQSRPNPASDHTLIVWDKPAVAGQKLQLEICTADGKSFRQISLTEGGTNAFKLETGAWPTGLYFYRLSNEIGHSEWKKMMVAR
ncbi:MAG: M14 family zinc carboxypeptidase [Saprospiraceae bacterium]